MSRPAAATMVRFCCVGVANLVLDLLLFNAAWALLGHRGGAALGGAALAAYAITTCLGYLANRAWSFGRSGALWRYLAVYAVSGMATAFGLPAAQERVWLFAGGAVLATSALKVGFALAVSGFNYAGLRWFVFQNPSPRASRRPALAVPALDHSLGGFR